MNTKDILAALTMQDVLVKIHPTATKGKLHSWESLGEVVKSNPIRSERELTIDGKTYIVIVSIVK